MWDYIYVADGSGGLQVLQFYGTGVEESPKPRASSHKLAATVIRSLPPGAVVFDAMGRRVVSPKPGVYFVRAEGRGVVEASRVYKVIVQR